MVPNAIADAYFGAFTVTHRALLQRGEKSGENVPRTPSSWTFSAIGDYGSGRTALADVTANIARNAPSLIVTTGDNVYYAGTEAEYRKKWDPPKMFGHLRSNFPVRPSLGNHDTKRSAKPYFDRFPELNGARYYSYDLNGVHFVAADTNDSLAPGTPQGDWLAKDLANSTADWKVLYLHHPLNPTYPGDRPEHAGDLAPLLAKHGVDLVLSGHQHNYARTSQLNKGGTIEVITGGGGQSLHPFVPGFRPAPTAYRDMDFGHVEVEVTPDRLVGRYIVRDGSVRDTFVIPNLTPGTKA
jgi:hypothetical protein